MFFGFLLVEIIVPNKTREDPNKKFIFIISLKNNNTHIEQNNTCN